MRKPPILLVLALFSTQANALELSVKGFENGKTIPPEFAFCTNDGAGKTRNGGNKNPEISWSGAPKETKSFALIVVDPDVPTKFDDANQEGKTIAADFPRQNFYHWVLVDIPANVSEIKEGAGKNKGPGVSGINDFASFMKDNPAETFIGYDGPCPPWNDKRLHHYHFQLYALDTESLGLEGAFTGPKAMEKINAHTLASGEFVGTYSNRIFQ